MNMSTVAATTPTTIGSTYTESFLKKLTDRVPGMLYQVIFYADGKVEYPFVSSGCKDIYGIEPDAVMKDASLIANLWHPDDVGGYVSRVEECKKTLQPFEYESRIVLPDGKIKWLKINSKPELLSNGAILFNGVRIDITRQKNADALLRESEARITSLINSTNDRIVCIDREYRITVANEAALEYIRADGYSENVFGKSVFEFIAEHEQSFWRRNLDRTLLGEQFVANLTRQSLHGTRYHEITFNPVLNDDGDVMGASAFLRDITDAKRAEEKILENSLQLDAAADIANIAFWTYHIPTALFTLNDRFYALCGRAAAEFNGYQLPLSTFLQEFVAPDDRAMFQERLLKLVGTHQTVFKNNIEYQMPHGDRSVRFMSLSCYTQGAQLEVFGVVQDVTERKKNEAELKQLNQELSRRMKEIQDTQAFLVQSEKMSSLGQMVAGIAHELNTPIGYVSNNVQLAHTRFTSLATLYAASLQAIEDIYAGRHLEALEKMQRVSASPNGTLGELEETIRRTERLFNGMSTGLEQMANLVRSMRNFSRLDEAEMKKADLNDSLQSCLLMIGHQFKDKDVELVTRYGKIPPVDCYPAQLNQVFLNLIQNAIHAVEKKTERRLSISTASEDGFVVVRVTDNGTGIPKHVQPKIFDPFFTTKPVGQGTGLGLSICYNIVQKHGGSLSFETEEGKGTTFIVKIPEVEFMTSGGGQSL